MTATAKRIQITLGRAKCSEDDVALYRRYPVNDYPAFAILHIRSKFKLPPRFLIVQKTADGASESIIGRCKSKESATMSLSAIINARRKGGGT